MEDVAMAFLAVLWGGAAGVLFRQWIFLHVMVGGGRGVAGPKELMGWVGTVTDGRSYSPSATCCNFVGVQYRFLKIIRPQCAFCVNLQHRLHVVKTFCRF
jgi:hypothetical protein